MIYVLVCFGQYMDIVIPNDSRCYIIDADGECDPGVYEERHRNYHYPEMKFWTL